MVGGPGWGRNMRFTQFDFSFRHTFHFAMPYPTTNRSYFQTFQNWMSTCSGSVISVGNGDFVRRGSYFMSLVRNFTRRWSGDIGRQSVDFKSTKNYILLRRSVCVWLTWARLPTGAMWAAQRFSSISLHRYKSRVLADLFFTVIAIDCSFDNCVAPCKLKNCDQQANHCGCITSNEDI
jgi:hypothetical protein